MTPFTRNCIGPLAAALLPMLVCCVATAGGKAAEPEVRPPTFDLTPAEKTSLLFPALRLPRDPSDRRCVRSRREPAPGWLVDLVQQPSCTPAARTRLDAPPEESGAASVTAAQDLLTLAAICGDDAAVAREIGHGADPGGHDACGMTPLVAAATSGHASIVRALLQAGAKPNQASRQSKWSRTPLVAAIAAHDRDAARALVEAGASVHARTPQGRTPLMLAVAANDEEVVRLLLQKRADACRRDANGMSALDVGQVHLNQRVMLALMKAQERCTARASAATTSRGGSDRSVKPSRAERRKVERKAEKRETRRTKRKANRQTARAAHGEAAAAPGAEP